MMLKDTEKPRERIRNEGQRNDVMLAQTHTIQESRTARRPLYDSIWLALFEILREELALRSPATLSRVGSLSPRQ